MSDIFLFCVYFSSLFLSLHHLRSCRLSYRCLTFHCFLYCYRSYRSCNASLVGIAFPVTTSSRNFTHCLLSSAAAIANIYTQCMWNNLTKLYEMEKWYWSNMWTQWPQWKRITLIVSWYRKHGKQKFHICCIFYVLSILDGYHRLYFNLHAIVY